MHLGIPALLNFYKEHRTDDSLVLVTIIATEGSTYRKPGAMMLISRDGCFEGMISGGCLEGDLLHHAAEVFEQGDARHLTYDMHSGDDVVWSLGLGCDGIIHLLLQRLDSEDGFGFLQELEKSFDDRRAGLFALATRDTDGLPAGSLAFIDNDDRACGNSSLVGLLRLTANDWPEWRCRTTGLAKDGDADGGAENVLLVHMPAQTRVLICGAGPDAVPVARALGGLDWDIRIVDHRSAFARQDRFPPRCRVSQVRPGQLAETVNLEQLDAAVIMSHHLENDAEYLSQLAAFEIPYIGVLGPAARRGKLSEMSGYPEQRLHGPVGLDIGAELPEAIALSIAAEVHAVLNGRDGRSLTLRMPAAGQVC